MNAETSNTPQQDVCLLLNQNIYGYYIAKTQEFTCTHGGWSSKIKFLDNQQCLVREVSRTKPMTYKVIEAIPEGYNRA